jgi:RNA polymerase sigma-70 factor (ECF subfamily)
MTETLLAASAVALFVLVDRLGGPTIAPTILGESPGRVVGAWPGRLLMGSQGTTHHPPPIAPADGAGGRPRLAPEIRPDVSVDEDADDVDVDVDLIVDELVRRARSGDSTAFALLYDRYYGNVYGNLYAKTRSRAVAEDLTSDTFVRALRAMAGYRSESRYFGAWLGKIARNVAIDHFTSPRSRHETLVDDLARHTARREHRAGTSRFADLDLEAAIKQLPDKQRRCIELRFLLDLSVAETAAYLGVTHGAAKQLQWRGLRNLERLLHEEASA